MMKIQKKQFIEIESEQKKQFCYSVVEFLNKKFPRENLSLIKMPINDFVESQFIKAQSLKILSSITMAKFIFFSMLIEFDFLNKQVYESLCVEISNSKHDKMESILDKYFKIFLKDGTNS